MLVLPLIIIVIVWYLLVCLKWKRNVFDIMEKMPGLRWYPVFGTFYNFSRQSREDVIYKFLEVSVNHERFYRSWNGKVNEVHTANPDHLQILMKNSTHTSKGPFYVYLFEWLGESVFLSAGAKWFFQRKLITPAFHFKILDGFTKTFGEKAVKLNKVLSKQADGEFFDALPVFQPITLSAICETSLGVRLEEVTDNPAEFVKHAHNITEMAMWRYWRPWIPDTLFHLLPQGRLYRKAIKVVHDFSARVVAVRKQRPRNPKYESEGKERMSFMDLILDAHENQQSINDKELQHMVDAFTFAGFETTANSLGWALFLLGNNPDIQEKAFEEVQRVLKGKEAPTTMDEVNQLQYIDCIIKEALRMYPALPFLTRKVSEDIELGGYKIPAGTQAILHVYLVQNDPKQYPEPEKFLPERFLPENSKERHPFAFIPFSAGPRNCLGMRFALVELRILLASVIKNFKVVSLEKPEDVKIYVHLLIRPQNGIYIKVEKRTEMTCDE